MSEDEDIKAFYDALSGKDWTTVRRMIDAGQVRDRDHSPALHAAVKDGDIHTVELILDLGKIKLPDFWKARNEAAMLGQMAVLRRMERTVTRLPDAEREDMNRDSLTNSRIQADRLAGAKAKARKRKKRVAV